MHTTNQTVANEPQCCVDYCQTTFITRTSAVVNKYKCNQKPFYTFELWNVQKGRKEFSIRTNLH